jgi:hypothetical protein
MTSGTWSDVTIVELGEFVTGHAFFVNRMTRRNETRARVERPAELQFAKNGRNE